ncbi:MAG: hypothetical protein ABI216_00605 [Devosia sp.]
MTKGFRFDPSGPTLDIINGSRTVYQLGSQMVEMLTTVETFSAVTVAFADLTKDNMVYWSGSTSWNPADPYPQTYHNNEVGIPYITAPPQESDVTQDLMDVPAGADFFAGQIKLSRTSAPSSWFARTIPVLPPVSTWLPFMGGLSLPLEAEFGFYRMLHLYIDAGAGKLRIGKQTSISVAPAGVAQAFASSGSNPASYWHSSAGSVAGLPFKLGTQSVLAYDNVLTGNRQFADRGGSSQPSLSISTNLASTYSVDIVGRFGRRTY